MPGCPGYVVDGTPPEDFLIGSKMFKAHQPAACDANISLVIPKCSQHVPKFPVFLEDFPVGIVLTNHATTGHGPDIGYLCGGHQLLRTSGEKISPREILHGFNVLFWCHQSKVSGYRSL